MGGSKQIDRWEKMLKAKTDDLTFRPSFSNKNLWRDEKRETKQLEVMVRSISLKCTYKCSINMVSED
jgi:hypothetical protein